MVQTARHTLIRRILADGPVRSQEDLRRRLARAGADVTQATLSRDLRAIGAVKGPAGYALGDHAANGDGWADVERAIRDYAAMVTATGQLIILRTDPGHAQPLALAIDRATLDAVAGTIAGDDTVFIATPTPKHAARLAERFGAVIKGGNGR